MEFAILIFILIFAEQPSWGGIPSGNNGEYLNSRTIEHSSDDFIQSHGLQLTHDPGVYLHRPIAVHNSCGTSRLSQLGTDIRGETIFQQQT